MLKTIIVEGPDGAGKTTLINTLRRAIGKNALCVHFGTPVDFREQIEAYADTLKENRNNNKTVIFDRCWYSDRVYAPIMRGRVETDLSDQIRLETLVKSVGGAIVIYCDAPLHILWDRCRSRGEDYITSAEVLNLISKEYHEVMRSCTLPMIYLDTSEEA